VIAGCPARCWPRCACATCGSSTVASRIVNVAMTAGERVRFERCRLERADFRAAHFEAVAWWDCDLTDAEFSQVRIVRAQLHGSTLEGLRGSVDLKPIGIDAVQFPVIAEHLLATMGIKVGERDET
jgi:hypothetical protein